MGEKKFMSKHKNASIANVSSNLSIFDYNFLA
jgi:hypothetical protein